MEVIHSVYGMYVCTYKCKNQAAEGIGIYFFCPLWIEGALCAGVALLYIYAHYIVDPACHAGSQVCNYLFFFKTCEAWSV